MQVLLLSLFLLGPPEFSQGYNEQDFIGREAPPMITVAMAALDPELMDRPVEVCGHVVGLYPERAEAMMAGRGKFLIVDTRGRAELIVRRTACVTGVIRRRDGENELQRRNNGLGFTAIVHAPSPDFLLYQCHDPASCDRLMQPGPVQDEQLDSEAPQAESGERGMAN